MRDEIKIVDVIHHYTAYSMQVFIVLDRMPRFVYERNGNDLTACDSGIYDFMHIQPGTTRAFAGRKFDIEMADGSTLECHGQVWHGRNGEPPEPLIGAGINTIEGLAQCHVYMGCGGVSRAKYEAWLAVNKPSYNYNKYDRRSSMAYKDELYRDHPDWDTPVCAKRAS